MGLTLAKCPACGAELNLEIDRDYFYCPNCGSKVLQRDERIVIEHVNRTVDEAEVKRVELEEKKRLDEKEKEKAMDESGRRMGKFFIGISAALLIFSFFTDEIFAISMRTISAFFIFVGALSLALSGKKPH